MDQPLADRLPLNRKERYYTGTVLPMIVCCDEFAHFGRFLRLCGVPDGAVVAGPGAAIWKVIVVPTSPGSARRRSPWPGIESALKPKQGETSCRLGP